jgi:hypothetical protein
VNKQRNEWCWQKHNQIGLQVTRTYVLQQCCIV